MVNDNVRQRIEALKLEVDNKLAISKVAARKLAQANDELIEAEARRDEKGNSKSAAKHAIAEAAYNECLKDFISFFIAYEARVDETLALYDDFVSSESSKNAKKIRVEAEKFEANQRFLKENVWDSLGMISGVAEAYDAALKVREERLTAEKYTDFEEPVFDAAEETVTEQFEAEPHAHHADEQTFSREDDTRSDTQRADNASDGNTQIPHGAPGYVPYHTYYPPQNVMIAPASIDISPIIEDAVNTAMKKFKVILDRHADELSEAASSSIVTTDKIVKSELEIAEAEAAVSEKLAQIMSGLKKLTDDLAFVADSCEKLIEVEKDVAERQRRVNDMQRTLVREMQGVQANQKVILGEQQALTDSQAMLAELQSANAENHKLILSAAGDVAEMQKNILKAQTAIGTSVREVVDSHKSIVDAEQAIIAANAKNIERQHELAEKQNELSALQKTIISEHKALARKVQAHSKEH